jgi:hypothetical protein
MFHVMRSRWLPILALTLMVGPFARHGVADGVVDKRSVETNNMILTQ